MKKQLLTIFTLSLGTMTFAQVGVNTYSPEATFDITAKTTTGTSVEGLLIPRVDRQKAQSMTTIPTSTLIYVNNIATGTLTGIAVNIDAIGYYYFNGTSWTKLTANTPTPEVDGIIGNEVLNATTGGALERSGAGTTASPYTLGVADQGITTAKIADNNVTYAKISNPIISVVSTYTLKEEDKGGFVYVTSTTPLTLTVPDTLSAGFHCVIVQQGTGQVTIAGNNLFTARGLKTRAQHSAIGVIKRGPAMTTITGDATN